MHITAIEQIRAAEARYCRFLDTKQWGDFAELLVLEVRVRMLDPDGQELAAFDHRDAFVASAREFLEGARSIHQVHNDELAMVSRHEVAATWSMEDCIVFPPGPRGTSASVHGYGHYHETWLERGDVWRIASLELRRTILETASPGGVS
jgi:SnoaL-like domain